MRTAIVGGGAAGLVAAHQLRREGEVVVFEAGDAVGGHVRTVRVALPDGEWDIDMGFIVHNERGYPNLVRLLRELGVATRPTDMSFGLRCERTGLEYNSATLDGLFAQRRNIVRPAFLRMAADIPRFYRAARRDLVGTGDPELTLGEYLGSGRWSRALAEDHVLPMAAAIWSQPPERLAGMPARLFAEFFHHHGLLDFTDRPTWRVIDGGSQRWVDALVAPFRDRLRTRSRVVRVERVGQGVRVHVAGREPESFDRVVLAVHSDQALALLADATPIERRVLASVPYQENDVVLHRDASLLPRRPAARAAWNLHRGPVPGDRVTVTYWMNRLQGLRASHEFCVTLNRTADIDPALILARATFHHPAYGPEAVRARPLLDALHAASPRVRFCGAWTGWGFHEDAVVSALRACALPVLERAA